MVFSLITRQFSFPKNKLNFKQLQIFLWILLNSIQKDYILDKFIKGIPKSDRILHNRLHFKCHITERKKNKKKCLLKYSIFHFKILELLTDISFDSTLISIKCNDL